MATTSKSLWLNAGAVAAAIGASLCCILPVAVALLGVGSAALGAQLEPFRPYCELPGYPYVQPATYAQVVQIIAEAETVVVY